MRLGPNMFYQLLLRAHFQAPVLLVLALVRTLRAIQLIVFCDQSGEDSSAAVHAGGLAIDAARLVARDVAVAHLTAAPRARDEAELALGEMDRHEPTLGLKRATTPSNLYTNRKNTI